MTNVQIDELDLQLIDLLAQDARVSNRKIAAELGVTEGTVRGRIKRLQQDRLIAFTAITGLEMAENSRLAFISVQAEVMRVRDVARQIADLDQINAVMSHDTRHRLKDIFHDTLVITGADDVLIPPEHSDLIAELITQSELVKIPKSGHGFFVEAAEEANRHVIKFLEDS